MNCGAGSTAFSSFFSHVVVDGGHALVASCYARAIPSFAGSNAIIGK